MGGELGSPVLHHRSRALVPGLPSRWTVLGPAITLVLVGTAMILEGVRFQNLASSPAIGRLTLWLLLLDIGVIVAGVGACLAAMGVHSASRAASLGMVDASEPRLAGVSGNGSNQPEVPESRVPERVFESAHTESSSAENAPAQSRPDQPDLHHVAPAVREAAAPEPELEVLEALPASAIVVEKGPLDTKGRFPMPTTDSSGVCARCGSEIPPKYAWRRCSECGRTLCSNCFITNLKRYGRPYCDDCATKPR